MRLRPAVTTEEALAWLTRAAELTWGVEITPELEQKLRPTAEAMVAVSSVDVPDDVEPLLL